MFNYYYIWYQVSDTSIIFLRNKPVKYVQQTEFSTEGATKAKLPLAGQVGHYNILETMLPWGAENLQGICMYLPWLINYMIFQWDLPFWLTERTING